MEIKVSIVIPIYNAEEYLNKCIDSILEQSLKEIEIILINDGSIDRSGEICDEYAMKDERIRVIHKLNEGVSRARNRGIVEASGKYIMFVDSDDYVNQEYCRCLYDLSEKYKNNLVICGFNMINNRGENVKKIKKNFDDLHLITIRKKREIYDISKKQLLNPLWNKIYNREILIKNKIKFIENISLGEDLLFNLEYLNYVQENIIILNSQLYNYELRKSESLDNKYYYNLFEIYKILNKELYNFMICNEVDISKYECDYYTSYLFMIHRVFQNTFNKANKESFIKKIKYNSEVMKSNEFIECLNKANLNIYSPLYIKLLKKREYIWIYIFEKVVKIKVYLNRVKKG